jgi:hypothetical protein
MDRRSELNARCRPVVDFTEALLMCDAFDRIWHRDLAGHFALLVRLFRPVSAALRRVNEFEAHNRPKGNAVLLSLSATFE